jgi:uncharacterized protein with HEPN domain
VIDQRTKLLLEDMLTNARLAREFVGDATIDAFAGDISSVYSATRAVEIVGEAASQVDPAVRGQLSSLPWRQAIAMRNRLIHGYRTLQARIIFETVRDDLPAVIAEIERLFSEEA